MPTRNVNASNKTTCSKPSLFISQTSATNNKLSSRDRATTSSRPPLLANGARMPGIATAGPSAMLLLLGLLLWSCFCRFRCCRCVMVVASFGSVVGLVLCMSNTGEGHTVYFEDTELSRISVSPLFSSLLVCSHDNEQATAHYQYSHAGTNYQQAKQATDNKQGKRSSNQNNK